MRTVVPILLLAALAGAGDGVWVELQQGIEAYQKGDLARAEALLRSASSDSRVKDARYYLGMVRIRKGDTKGGCAMLLEVPEDAPTFGHAQRELGMRARAGGNFEAACKHLEAAAKARPSLDTLLELGKAQLDAKRFDAAEATLKRAEELSKGNVDVFEVQARLYLETARHKEALERFEAIAKALPSDVSARFGKAICLELLRRPAEAIAELEALLEKDPAHVGALERLIALYGEDRERASAKEALRKRLEWLRKNPPKVAPPPAAAQG